MYDNGQTGKYYGHSSAVKRELEAIEEDRMETTVRLEHDVIESFNEKVFKSLKKIVIKITKAS